ncbi:MAG: DNA primase [Defluviitaleaceae bacterium]|nr:DNA primase [Defluviitaleaceae bacterium]
MAGYSQDVLEDLRQGNDIIDVISQYVQLKSAGANHMGLCPFHNEKSPSFSVSSQKQLFHCFGCGVSGNVFSFVMKIENFAFLDAIKFLADRINYNLPPLGSATPENITEKNQMYEAYKLAARYYYDILQEPQGRAATAYLDSRRITPAARRKFGLGVSLQGGLGDMLMQKGYNAELLTKAGLIMQSTRGDNGHFDRFRNRLMFPIFDVSGKVIGFGGRMLGGGQPKYMNSPETPIFDKSRTLYGLNYARLAKTDTIILVEGYMDVIAMYQAGFTNTVAALGTAFTANAARILKRYCKQTILLFDGDEAGTKATLRATGHLYTAGLAAKVATLPNAKDPDEFIINYGTQALIERLKVAEDFVEFEAAIASKKYNLDVSVQKIAFQNEISEILKRLNTPIERDTYLRDISAKYGIDQAAMKEHIAQGEGEQPYVPPPRQRKREFIGITKGFAEAASHILHSMAHNEDICGRITAHLEAEMLIEPIYIKLYETIVAARMQGAQITPADVVTFMQDAGDQNAAAEIFTHVPEYESTKAQIDALGQQIYTVKELYYGKIIGETDQTTDFDKFIDASTERNKLKMHKISL